MLLTWIKSKLKKRNINALSNLKRQRVLITTEGGIIMSATPVPDDSYITHNGNIDTVSKLCRATSSN